MNLNKNFVSVQYIEMMIVIYLGDETDIHIFKTVVLQLASMFVKLITTSAIYIVTVLKNTAPLSLVPPKQSLSCHILQLWPSSSKYYTLQFLKKLKKLMTSMV